MINLAELTIESAHAAMKKGDYTPADLAQAYLDGIAEKNGDINAYLEIYDDVMDQAARAQARFQDGSATLLTGIPFAMKDNILIKGRIASASSKMLENYTAVYDSSVVQQLIEAGAVLLGRTNMDEFAMGSSTETSAFGMTKNPVNRDYVPGGSSGGSAAAVAMDGALASLGSDTGGSIRQPAAFCGLVGLYPTYGSVSRFGLMALASSLDQIGPMTKTVRDAEIIFDAISGYDHQDATNVPLERRAEIRADMTGKKIGVPKDFLEMEGIDPQVMENFQASLEKLKAAGYEIVDIELPHAHLGLPTYYIIQPAEASTNLSRYDGMRYGLRVPGTDLESTYTKTREQGFGSEVQRRIMLGTYVLSAGQADAYYYKARDIRELIKRDFAAAFASVDVIATPTTPSPAFKPGEKQDPVSMYMADVLTVPVNLAGVPAISVPSGMVNDLPVGIQFIAPHFCEDRLFTVGKDFEARG